MVYFNCKLINRFTKQGGIIMNTIITIGRQFSSGGREIGKRLADTLNFAYYDKEIIDFVAKESGFDTDYIEQYSEARISRAYPLTYGRTFSFTYLPSPAENIQILQTIRHGKIIFDKKSDIY